MYLCGNTVAVTGSQGPAGQYLLAQQPSSGLNTYKAGIHRDWVGLGAGRSHSKGSLVQAKGSEGSGRGFRVHFKGPQAHSYSSVYILSQALAGGGFGV